MDEFTMMMQTEIMVIIPERNETPCIIMNSPHADTWFAFFLREDKRSKIEQHIFNKFEGDRG